MQLAVEEVRASEGTPLDLHLHLIDVVAEAPVLVDDAKQLVNVELARPIDEDRPPNLIYSKVGPRIKLN